MKRYTAFVALLLCYLPFWPLMLLVLLAQAVIWLDEQTTHSRAWAAIDRFYDRLGARLANWAHK